MTHVLIIDDNPYNIEVLALLLTSMGVAYTALEHPHEVDAALQQLSRVDVIFLDLELPDEDGFEVFARLRTHPSLRGTRFVAYTVHISEIDRARSVGFHSFIGKPLRSRDFPAQLWRILNGDSVWEV